jgi:hypothetical protein
MLFCLAGHDIFMSSGTEIGDFAANSLLVQEAKHFNLFVGNYSRVGFNHPGPAILYVLAMGEVLFYDWLHWVHSPMAGQLVAVALYNAFWMTLFARLLHHYSKSIVSTIIVVTFFIFISSSVAMHGFFTGAWFPHLYYGPFAVLLLALARFAEGRNDALFSLALSTGFLINGHVSFVPMLGIMLGFALIYNYFAYRNNRQNRIVASTFLHDNKIRLLQAVAVLLVFFIPLVIETIRDFPGPIYNYAVYDVKHSHNSLADALHFVGLYWHGVYFALLAAVLGFIVYYKSAVAIRSILMILLAASAALLFYALFGIDQLSFDYIGYFYYAVPALFAAILLLAVINNLPQQIWLTCLRTVLILIGVGLTYKNISQPPQYIAYYSDSQVRASYAALDKIKTNGRLALDIDTDEWMKLVGIASYAKRQNNNLFCIGKHWHILFTKKLRCSREDLLTHKRFFVAELSKLPADAKPAFIVDGLAFFPIEVLTLKENNYYNAKELATSLNNHWSEVADVTDGYTWSIGRKPKIYLKLPANFSGQLILDVGAYLPRPSSHQEAAIYIDGKYITTATFSINDNRKHIILPLTNQKQRISEVQMEVKSPIAPSSVTHSADTRKFGVALHGLKIKRENEVTS